SSVITAVGNKAFLPTIPSEQGNNKQSTIWISERYPCLSELVKEYQPKKLFFMAVDGVAPRAKMNQQRGRRFRSAKEAEILEQKARERGEALPSEARFDSNCITPGTDFMAKLQEQLKYFVTFKLSTDPQWRGVKIILSGHETPGEGEHKIMDYIRYMKAQPGYDANTRHCLYGLDADLIMLGLCSHEPHFSLLREEVKYGRKAKQTRTSTPEETKFFLLHLSLMREYLELEFSALKSLLPFPFDIEKIIDDWVLMGFLVGNDFIPPLPDMHIINGALPTLYKAYISVLPTLGGYINEGGTLNLERFKKYMLKLSAFDLEQFRETYADLKYFQGKTGRRPGAKERHTDFQTSKNIYRNSGDKELEDLVDLKPVKNAELAALIQNTESDLLPSDEDDSDEIEGLESCDSDDENGAFEVLRSQADGYVRAIQWNLHYYYDGVCSWSWFYPHHYAPYISDICKFSDDLELNFDLGTPFLPFEQLLAVLPAASKKLLPEPYQQLMVEKESPIFHYYPSDFKTDLNGKKQEWEAVVLIPFIDEVSLLNAMAPCAALLTEEERNRNSHGPMHIYTYTEENLGVYEAPQYYPPIKVNHAAVQRVSRSDIHVEHSRLVKGLCPGVRLDVYFPGFPTLKHLAYTARFSKNKVKVFEQPSQGTNVILHITDQGKPDIKEVATELLGKTIFVSWPHLVEARVVAVSNRDFRYGLIEDGNSGGTIRFNIEEWLDTPVAYALQTTVRDIAVHDRTFQQFKTLQEVFPPKSICFMLGHPHYGAMGEVVDGGNLVKSGRVKVNMSVTPEPNLDGLRKQHHDTIVQYMPGNVAAQWLGVSSHLVSRVTGTIYIVQGDKNASAESCSKINVGLNLKFNKRNEEIPGYTRKDGSVWQYSNKAVELVRNYMQKCVTDIMNWLKEQPYTQIERHVCGSEIVEAELVQALEKEVDEFQQHSCRVKTVTMQVKPHLLYKPGIQMGNIPPDPQVVHRLFDRIVNVRESYTVPLGLKGTIVGIHRSDNDADLMYDVVFDKPFPGGLALNCSAGRGYRLPKPAMVNLSHGQRVELVKTVNKPTAVVQPSENAVIQDSHSVAPWNQGRTSAFASWNKNQQAVSSNFAATQFYRALQQPQQRIPQHVTNSAPPQPAFSLMGNRQPTSMRKQKQNYLSPAVPIPAVSSSSSGSAPTEFQDMWTQLQKKTSPLKPNPSIPSAPVSTPDHVPIKAPNNPIDGSATSSATVKLLHIFQQKEREQLVDGFYSLFLMKKNVQDIYLNSASEIF
ncbi:5'-3' exoribonuclease 1, partial [Blattella germanica]